MSKLICLFELTKKEGCLKRAAPFFWGDITIIYLLKFRRPEWVEKWHIESFRIFKSF